MSSRIPRWLVNGSLLGGSCLFCLLAAEIALRLFTPEAISYRNVRVSDPVLHHRLRPSAKYTLRGPDFREEVKTNSLGMRDYEYAEPSGPETRILVLGDSYTEGYGVPAESCFVKILERKFNQESHAGVRTRVFNGGIAGYSPLLEFLYLKEVGLRLHPDLVVMCYDMTDVQEDAIYSESATFDSTGTPVRVSPSTPSFGRAGILPEGRLKTLLTEYSYVYLTLKTYLSGTVAGGALDANDFRVNRYLHTVDSTGNRWEPLFERSQSYIALTDSLCRANRIAFLLSVHPTGHQVNSLEWAEGRKYWGLEARTYNSVIFRSLKSFAQRKGIPFVDMTDTFRRKSTGDLYFPNDGHWTPKGHRVVADTLYQFITATMSLPSGKGLSIR